MPCCMMHISLGAQVARRSLPAHVRVRDVPAVLDAPLALRLAVRPRVEVVVQV